MRNQVKQTTFGAMMLAIVGVFLTLNTLSAGLLLAVIPFFVPIPYVFFTKEYGLKAGLVLWFSTLMLGLMITPPHFVVLTLLYGMIGIVYGEGVRRKLNDKYLFFTSFIGIIIVYLVTMFLFGAIFEFNILEQIDQVVKLVRTMSVVDSTSLTSLVTFIFLLSIILQGVLEAFVIHMLCTILFLYLKHEPVRRVKLSSIQYPAYLGVISAGFMLLMFKVQDFPQLQPIQLAIKFLGALGFFYLSYLGLLAFYKNPRFYKWRVYSIIMFIFTLSIFAPIHIGIGLFTSLSGYWRDEHERKI